MKRVVVVVVWILNDSQRRGERGTIISFSESHLVGLGSPRGVNTKN